MIAVGQAADTPSAPAETELPTTLEDLLEAGKTLWDQHAPAEIREQYAFPTPESVETFLVGVEQTLSAGDFAALAGYEINAQRALSLLRQWDAGEQLADWLEPRLDLLRAAGVAVETSEEETVLRSRPMRPGETSPPPSTPPAPRVDPRSPLSRPYWDQVVVGKKPPARAGALVPELKKIFAAKGIPPAWVWIAEVESSMDPKARSPAGARGLFQFMPETAKRFGLSVTWPDERTDPAKSAAAAADYLRILYNTFGSWPLAVAAYNAGEGRVGRALKSSGATTFSTVSKHLPAETRLYVPKVLATVAARERIDPEKLPAP